MVSALRYFSFLGCLCLGVVGGGAFCFGQAPPGGAGNADAMFRSLDADRNGRLTMAEAGPHSRTLLERIFEMASKPASGSVSREEFQVVFDRHRAGETGPSNSPTPRRNDRPMPETEPAPRRNSNVPEAAPAAAADAAALQGVWRGWVVRGRGENPNEGEMEVELTIRGNQIQARELGTRRAPGGLGAGTFTLTRAEGYLDADGTEGPQSGRHYMGVYELRGNTLRWCVTGRGRQRPTTMATERGNYLMILEKQSGGS